MILTRKNSGEYSYPVPDFKGNFLIYFHLGMLLLPVSGIYPYWVKAVIVLTSCCFPQHTHTHTHTCAGRSVVSIFCMEIMNQRTQTFKMMLNISNTPSEKIASA